MLDFLSSENMQSEKQEILPMKILVVDDELLFGSLLGRALRRLGHRPILAVDPRDALDMVDHGIDAVITDLDMPGMNGVELARAIRARHEQMPIAFCTGSSPGDTALVEAATIGRVLPKVWSTDEVKELIADLEGSSRHTAAPAAERQAVGSHLGIAGKLVNA
jgi:CheY-like chemotaxis protein